MNEESPEETRSIAQTEDLCGGVPEALKCSDMVNRPSTVILTISCDTGSRNVIDMSHGVV